MNNTNIIDIEELKFTENYILDNLEMLIAFLNFLILNKKIDVCIIKNLEISRTTLLLINNISNIKKVIFLEDTELKFSISSMLLENKFIEEIDCYSMPEIMFKKFTPNIVKTRCEILFTSDFMNFNHISTYSELCNKDKISVNGSLNNYDLDEVNYFFYINENLRRIIIRDYKRETLLYIIDLLKNTRHKKVTIIIYESFATTKNILNDMSLLNELNKSDLINIKIKYSLEYKKRNYFKELNVLLLKTILLIVISCVAIIFFVLKKTQYSDEKNMVDNLSVIDEIVEDNSLNSVGEEVENSIGENEFEYISPYYTNYTKVYEELLKINVDTIGWLKISNTKIDYPVVQYSDNDYYLNHAFDGTKNAAGWIFADYRNDMNLISKNTILYGHDVQKNNLLFGSLKNVLSESWYINNENTRIYFNIKGNDYYFQVFSIYTTEVTNDYLISDFSSNASFMNYVNKIKVKSIYNFNIDINENDKLLTLSTCYNDSNYRLVVHAKKN